MKHFIMTVLGLVPMFGACGQSQPSAGKTAPMVVSEFMKRAEQEGLEVATLGTGCFWCTEAIFEQLRGVVDVESGYAGGHVPNPSYEAVCGKKTGHAETVQILFDPEVISFAELLEVFWRVHDPTKLNRQGNDVGPQYRSAIFYHSEAQKTTAQESLKSTDASDLWKDPIVTEVTAYTNYYSAEGSHQDYYRKVGSRNPYCTYVIDPKVEKFQKLFEDKLKQ